MSFILDALKKSETDRQERNSAEFARVPTSSGPARAPAWLWLLGFLLAVNLVVLMGLFLKPSSDIASSVSLVDEVSALPDSGPALVAPKVSDSGEDQPSFASRVAAAKQSQPTTSGAITPNPADVDVGQPSPSGRPGRGRGLDPLEPGGARASAQAGSRLPRRA